MNREHDHDHGHRDDHRHQHQHQHDYEHHEEGRGNDHGHPGGLHGLVHSVLRPHSHDAADAVDSALAASAEGIRALKISLAGLTVTAAAQLAVVLLSGSVALLADMVHNFGDALTAVPVGIALVVGRRPVNRCYTYGYGRAEDLAGLSVLAAMTASAIFAAYEAVVRLVHPQPVHDLGWVAAAGLIGLAGNEFAAVYRIRTGRRIGSAALVADGLHARADGLTSLAVVVGAAGTAAGWVYADPAVGLFISATIVAVLRQAAREVYGRLMDRVDERTLALAERAIQGIPNGDRTSACGPCQGR